MSPPSVASYVVSAPTNHRQPGSLPGDPLHAVTRTLVTATLFGAPLAFGAVLPWAWATLSVLASFSLLLWAVGGVRRGAVRIHWSPLYLPALLFLVLGAIQYFGYFTVDRVGTREAALKLATDLILFFLAGQLWANSSEKGLVTFGLAVTVYTFLLSASAILQFFSGSTFNYLNYWATHSTSGAFGCYVNPDHYAGLMEMLIPLACAFALSRQEGRSKRGLFSIGIILPIGSALLTGSRGGFIALLVEMGIFAAVLLRGSWISGQRRLTSLGLLAVTAAAVFFFWLDPGQMSRRLEQLFNLSMVHEASYASRAQVALDSIHVVRQHPWIGTGMGTFEIAYARFQTIPTDLRWNHAHNDFVEAVVESGIVGGVVIAVALVIFFRFAFLDLAHRLRHEAGWIRFGATVGCCGLLVHSLMDFNLRDPATAAWFAVCAAISIGPVASSRRRGVAPPSLVN